VLQAFSATHRYLLGRAACNTPESRHNGHLENPAAKSIATPMKIAIPGTQGIPAR
jgi:hypothetical protein